MSEADSSPRKQLGLLLASLVLLADSIPLGLWGLRIWVWIQDLLNHPSRDSLAAIFESIGTCILGLLLLILIAATLAMAVAAIHVASGKEKGLVTGILAGFTTGLVCAYLAYIRVSLDPRPWIAYGVVNAATAIYLVLYRLRQLKEQGSPSAE